MKSLLLRLIRPFFALLFGALLSAAYAPFQLAWMVWVFPAGLLFLLWAGPQRQVKGSARKGFGLSYLAGLGFWLPNVWWVGAVSTQAGWLSAGALALYLSLYFGLWGAFAATLGRARSKHPGRQPAFSMLYIAALNASLWCGLEWLRGLGKMSYGWDGLGVPLLDSAFVIAQGADLVGVNGLSFLPVFCGAILVQVVQALPHEMATGKRRIHWEVIGAAVLLAGFVCYGVYRLGSLSGLKQETLRVLIIQRNIPLSVFRDREAGAQIYREFDRGMEQAFSEITQRAQKTLEEKGEVTIASPDLVLWPESSLPTPIFVSPEGKALIDQENARYFEHSIRPYGDFLFITGVNQYPTRRDENGSYHAKAEGPFYNSMAFFAGGFETYAPRPKHHLMPFGEYLPFENTRLFQTLYAYFSGQSYQGSFSPAPDLSPQTLSIPGKQLSSVIALVCYEDTVGSRARSSVRPEPQIMVNITNNGWFAGTACSEKHFQNARFRTIELRRPLARAANTGVSAIVDITGSVARPGGGQPQILSDEQGRTEVAGALEGLLQYPVEPVSTLYHKGGHVFSWLAGGFALFFGWIGRFIDLYRV